MDKPAQERACGQNHRFCRYLAAVEQHDAADRTVRHQQIVDFAFDNIEIRGGGKFGLHRLAIELSVLLGPRPTHRGTFAAVEDAKLYTALVGDPSHDAIERVDFPDQMALAQPADGRIAAHFADRCESVRDESRRDAKTRRGGCSFRSRVSSTDNNDAILTHDLSLDGVSRESIGVPPLQCFT